MINIKEFMLMLLGSALVGVVCLMLNIDVVYVEVIGALVFAITAIALFSGKQKQAKQTTRNTKLPPKN
ncbi:hypothetical protein [Vibrio splendidus]|uniref:hypothetical protein n=1 Tax=Vibrio splendidus TaxID=29497 RepID=UPI003D110C0C